MLTFDADALLADLEPAQREAVTTVRGPLCILAGAGTGKTRVITRRVAYALATEAVRPADVLVVTFTDKAATEMRERLAAAGRQGRLGLHVPRGGLAPAPSLLAAHPRRRPAGHPSSKVQILAPLAATLPGGYRYLAVRDLAGGDRMGQGPPHLAGDVSRWGRHGGS